MWVKGFAPIKWLLKQQPTLLNMNQISTQKFLRYFYKHIPDFPAVITAKIIKKGQPLRIEKRFIIMRYDPVIEAHYTGLNKKSEQDIVVEKALTPIESDPMGQPQFNEPMPFTEPVATYIERSEEISGDVSLDQKKQSFLKRLFNI